MRGNKSYRDQSRVWRADYALFYKAQIPIAVVEAKDNNKAMGAGMAQAINYANLCQRLDAGQTVQLHLADVLVTG